MHQASNKYTILRDQGTHFLSGHNTELVTTPSPSLSSSHALKHWCGAPNLWRVMGTGFSRRWERWRERKERKRQKHKREKIRSYLEKSTEWPLISHPAAHISKRYGLVHLHTAQHGPMKWREFDEACPAENQCTEVCKETFSYCGT